MVPERSEKVLHQNVPKYTTKPICSNLQAFCFHKEKELRRKKKKKNTAVGKKKVPVSQ